MKSKVFDELIVVKRSGQRVNFNGTKIAVAIKSAFDDVYESLDENNVNKIYEQVLNNIYDNYQDRKTINVEDIQDIIEHELKKENLEVYERFKDYRTRRAASREAFNIKQTHKFVKAVETIGLTAKNKLNDKPLELINRFGKIVSKEFASAYLIDNKSLRAHDEGAICINNLDSYALGNIAACNIKLDSIKEQTLNAFFIALNNLIIKSAKDVYKEVVVSNFDISLIKPLIKEYKKIFKKNIELYLDALNIKEYLDKNLLLSYVDNLNDLEFKEDSLLMKNKEVTNVFKKAREKSFEELENILKYNLQVLFNSLKNLVDKDIKITITLNNEDTRENLMIIENYFSLELPEKLVTNIYVKSNSIESINIIKKAILEGKVIHFINLEDTNCNYFSSGEKVYENINDEYTSVGRTINSQTTINLCRCALKAKNENEFFGLLSNMIDISKNALQQRYELQANKYKSTYNIIFNPNILFGSEKVEDKQKVRKVIRNGNLYIGFVGLTEAVLILNKTEVIEEKEQKLLFKILDFINSKCESYTESERLNFKTCEIYDEKILQELIKFDKSVYGITKILDKSRYSNLNDYINNLNILSKYQNKTSCLITIKSKKSDLTNIFEEALKSNITYFNIKVIK